MGVRYRHGGMGCSEILRYSVRDVVSRMIDEGEREADRKGSEGKKLGRLANVERPQRSDNLSSVSSLGSVDVYF